MRRRATGFITLVFVMMLGQGTAWGADARSGGSISSEVIVRYRAGLTDASRAGVRAAFQARRARPLHAPGLEVLSAPAGTDPRDLAAALERRPEVLAAEPVYLRRVASAPNDPRFSEQWGLQNTGQNGGTPGDDIDASTAWSVTTGSSSVVVAVVDTGIDDSHPDLAANIWRNPGETGGGKETNGVDDDHNGFVDDWRGWDFVGDDNDPFDENGHGTHVGGVIGAQGNNGTGVAGVGWSVRLMPLRVLDAHGEGTSAGAIDAYDYARRMGARVLNLSFSGPDRSSIEEQTIGAAGEILFVVAAGNAASDIDAVPSYPCSYPAANIVCVTASDRADQLASFSNYGATTVDLAAPGVGVLSTYPGGYATASGSSMATPFVSGAAALVRAHTPSATAADVRTALLTNVDPVPGLAGKVAAGGRLDAAKAVGAVAPPGGPTPAVTTDTTPPSTPSLSGTAFSAAFQTHRTVGISWTAADDSGVASYDVRYRRAPAASGFGSYTGLRNATTNTSASVTLSPGYTYCFGARARDAAGNISGWSADRCTAAPLGDRSLSAGGTWRRSTGSYYLGTYSYSRTARSTLRRTVAARRLALVATRCPGCGTVDVYLGSTLLRRLSLGASTTRRTQILAVANFASVRSGTVTIKVYSSGKPVTIEGLGASRV